ncbi:putative protein LplC [Paenibacillus sp. oral taxon 786 str. D14]|uniref:carbohydrate ABC transporter permease n=1 Tax=Paenibacillus sp. oral taxon 786 TaxID=652715 RepID=UPI0001AFD504|nr:carbohydrate ABC transporter permease [Paenibacillus sp. oral taxon 786]EES72399.1 putative protein LplC [Paenibacillus sp. oral taxon 786 str. D14]
MKLARSDKWFVGSIYIFLVLLLFVTFYPFWNALVISLNSGSDTARGGITFWPRDFTFENYLFVMKNDALLQGFMISVLRVIAGTILALIFTGLFAYAMSKKHLIGRRAVMVYCIITMVFSGGLIPSFIINRNLGLMDNFWVMVIPSIISVWNMIVFRTFFEEIPPEMEESAKLDGCGYFGSFFRVILPLSKPVFATLGLFTAVYHWNDWFTASIYINTQSLKPIQTILQQVLSSTVMMETMVNSNASAQEFLQRTRSVTNKSITMTTMIVATLPIVCVYPFLQKYFVKGVMIGAVKG